jgi:hypothetical protein
MRGVIEMFFERRSRVLRAALLCWMCVAAACGGSGSSGFDGEPASGEPEAIMKAVEEGRVSLSRT